MKLVIDKQTYEKYGISLEQLLILLSFKLSRDYQEAISDLEDRGMIVFNNLEDTYSVTQNWNDILDDIICDSSEEINDEKRLTNLAKKIRECFPEGKMPGTAYYYRCNNREIFLKLKKFFTQYGNYTDEEIIDATKRFVASYQGNYRYLPLAKYFISKNKTITDEDGTNHITEVSPLATYLENKEDAEISNSDDWLMSSRN